jgi:hypothetical protein
MRNERADTGFVIGDRPPRDQILKPMTETFFADPRRDASAVIRGFVYQVDLTIRRWLDLQEDERLELERGEDIDIVARGIASNEDEQRITEQVKNREANLTLRSAAAVEAVANFALHRERNPGRSLLFRFTTNARAGVEQNVNFPGALPGIVAWQRLQSGATGEAEEIATARVLRDFYRQLPRPTGIGEEAWDALQRSASADDREWLAFLAAFEWSLESGAPTALPAAIQETLITSGLAGAGEAESLYQRLFTHVFRLLATDGEKILDRGILEDTLARTPDPTALAQIVALRDHVTLLEQRMQSGERRLSDVEETQRQVLSVVFGGVASAVAASAQFPTVGVIPIPLATDPPAVPAHRTLRGAVVRRLADEQPAGWLALHGDTGSGKTQLVQLLAEHRGSFLWLRLTDLPPSLAAGALRRLLEETTHLDTATSRAVLLSALFTHTPIRMVVLDDLPRIDGRSLFADDLLALGRAAHEAGTLIASTSLHRPPPALRNALGAALREIASPSLSEEEVEEISMAAGAPPQTARTLAPLIHTIGEGHPALVAVLAQHLSRLNWIMTADDLLQLVAGDHVAGTRGELLARLLDSIVEEPTRELLYRMMLAVGDVSLGEVRGLADAPPTIDHPAERLSRLEGLWVQMEDDHHIRVPPLIKLLGTDDLPTDVRRFCYARLAAMRMRRGELTPLDVMKVITYFMSAGLYYQAGLAAAQGFMELERLGPIPDAGLSDWFMWSLPEGMPAGIKLFVRGTQLGMRLKWKKDVSFLLSDIDTILAQTDNPFERSGIIIPAGKLLTADPAAAWRALPLLRHAMTAHDDGLRDDLPVVPIPDAIWVQSVFLAGYSISNDVGIREFQRTIETLSPARRATLDELEELEQMFVSIPGNIFLAMYRQPADVQDWPGTIETIRALAAWARQNGWPLLHAHATRIMLVILGEHLHDIERVITDGTASLDETADARSHGLIEATVARQLNLRNRWADARTWYARALGKPPSSIAPLEFDALLGAANAEQEVSLATSLVYLDRAIVVADGSDDLLGRSAQFAARAELAVALLLNGDQSRALSLWEEAGGMLLVSEPDDDTAKGRIRMFLTHSAYFYFSAAGLMGSIRTLPPERQPTAPTIGQFHADLRAFGRDLNPSWRGRVALIIGKLAALRGDTVKAKQYGESAIAAFQEFEDVPVAAREEASRLAAGEFTDDLHAQA